MIFAQLIIRKFVPPGLDKLRSEGKAEGLAEGFAQGLAEGFAQGLAQGETQGRAAAYTEFRDWLNRREAAIAMGETFYEPAPDEVGKPSDAGGEGRGRRECASEFPGGKRPELRCGSAGAIASAGGAELLYWTAVNPP